MTKGSIDARRKKFIQLMVPVDTIAGMIAAYKKSFPTCKKDETARVGSYALLRIPTIVKAIDEKKREREALIKKTQDEEIQRIAREQIATQVQLEATLSNIALGKQLRKRTVSHFDIDANKFVFDEYDDGPSETDQISAADKLLKVKGAYAPLAVKHESSDSFIELMKSVASLGNKTIPNAIPEGTDSKV